MSQKLVYIFFMLAVFFSCGKDEIDDLASNEVMKFHDSRPNFHFSPKANWINDPNGMVYYEGTYHLFYQYYPEGANWGPMHWGHATSTDLFAWEEKPIALYPDNLGYIFSGCAVADMKNTAGFKQNENIPLVAVFTHHGSLNGLQQQSLAYSTDKGNTWIKYQGNPVLPNPGINDFRDPKVIWYETNEQWIMVVSANDRIKIYSSPNLKDWTFQSDFGMGIGYHGGVWECPDLFPLTDENGTEKWVMIVSLGGGEDSKPNGGSATQYFIGSFDGKEFKAENNEVLWVDYGIDNYAGVTWSNIPKEDGRRIFIGWMSNWMYAGATPTGSWRGEMTVPREIKLIQMNGKYALTFLPVIELNEQKNTGGTVAFKIPQKSVEILKNEIIEGGSFLVEMEIDFTQIDNFEIETGNALENLKVNYNKESGEFVINRGNSGKVDFHPVFKRPIKCEFDYSDQITPIKMLIDNSSVELFINKGEKVMTALFFPQYKYNFIKVMGSPEKDFIKSFTLSEIKKTIIK
jgi:fructan beta-fructosidase